MTARRIALASLLPVAVIAIETPRAFLWTDAGAADETVQAPGKYFGASTCDGASCHTKPEARKEPPYLTEYTSWSAPNPDTNLPYDRHSYAFKRLKPKDKGGDDKSPAIMAKLNSIESTSETADTSERCLTCHGVAIHDYGVGKKNPGAAVGKHKELQGGKFRSEDGVSCDGCHGPAEKWLKKHDKKAWTTTEWTKDGGRAGGSQKLYDEYGIYYSKDLELWANQCIRCHLKIDTHLVDAGHPELQSFELYSQSYTVAPHWRDYTLFAPSPELPSSGPMHAASVWQTGQIAALREALQQVIARARTKDAKSERVSAAITRAWAHYVAVRPALGRFAPDAAPKILDAMLIIQLVDTAGYDLQTKAKAAEDALELVKPLVRVAADTKIELATVTAEMKALATDPQILDNPANAALAVKALYALNYSRLAQVKPESLTANPPDDPIMKAVFANFDNPDPKNEAFKSALASIAKALE